MFTGIIQSVGKLRQEKNILEIEILDNLFDMAIGDSIAVDGICLTVKEIFQNKFTVDVSEETLKKTTLGVKSNLNQIVNLEPALRVSDRLGGHIVSGHIDGLGDGKNSSAADLIFTQLGSSVMETVIFAIASFVPPCDSTIKLMFCNANRY